MRRLTLLGLIILVLVIPAAVYGAGGAFTDDDTSIFEADIEWMAKAGVTKGCDTGLFCPEDNVTRGQMAAFMHRLAINKVVDAATAVEADHATSADSATTAGDANTLDGMDSTAFLGVAGKASDSDKLDGMDSTAFASSSHDHDADYLALTGKAADADMLDGKDSTAFMQHGDIIIATDDAFATAEIGSSCTSYADLAVTVDAPVAGTIVVHANVQIQFSYEAGGVAQVALGIRTTPTDCTINYGYDTFAYRDMGVTEPTGTSFETLPLSQVIDVGPGIHTVYINGLKLQGLGAISFSLGSLDAVFYPAP